MSHAASVRFTNRISGCCQGCLVRAVLILLICTQLIGGQFASAQTVPKPEDFNSVDKCEATRYLASGNPVRPLNVGFDWITPDSTSNLSACFGIYYGRHDVLEACKNYSIDFNR